MLAQNENVGETDRERKGEKDFGRFGADFTAAGERSLGGESAERWGGAVKGIEDKKSGSGGIVGGKKKKGRLGNLEGT